jgi:hypothetical protein
VWLANTSLKAMKPSAELLSFLIPAISLTGLDRGCCLLLNVLSQGATLIVRLLELAVLIPPHIPLV